MPNKDDLPSIKNEEQYEALREKGYSKAKAARIANTEDSGKKGGKATKYDKRTKEELYQKVQKLGIEGRSNMTKEELIEALGNHLVGNNKQAKAHWAIATMPYLYFLTENTSTFIRMTEKITPFHIAIPVHNLDECRTFYREILVCEEGRSSDHWVDFNLFGHQLVIHYKPKSQEELHTNPVDGKNVPVPHYGVVLPWQVFESFSKDLKEKGVDFIIEPYVRFKGEVGEQATMFFLDPAGNALEFKAFKDMGQLFAK